MENRWVGVMGGASQRYTGWDRTETHFSCMNTMRNVTEQWVGTTRDGYGYYGMGPVLKRGGTAPRGSISDYSC